MRFRSVHWGNLLPLLGFKHVLVAFGVPFVLLIDTSNQVYALIVVNQAVRGISGDRDISQLEDFRRTASKHQMGINDTVIFCASYDVYISIGYDNGLGVVRQILQLFKLLNFIVFILNVVQEAMVFFYGENR